MSFKEFIINRTKLFFEPLKYKSVWIISAIGSLIMVYFIHIKG